MSVVARQSFKYSIIGYLGFLLGMVSAVFIFPSDLTYYGKLRYILPAAQMYMTVVVFGLSFSNVYFFGRLKEVNKQQNFLSWSLLLVAINFVVFTGGFFAIFSKGLKFVSLKSAITIPSTTPITAASAVTSRENPSP